MNTDLSITTRSSLLERVKDLDDEASWRDFCRTYSDLVKRLALKGGLTKHEADDVLQEVLRSMVRNIGAFKYDPSVCSFRRWLSNMTHWRIIDQWKGRLPVGASRDACGNTGTRRDALERIADPSSFNLEAAWEAEWKKNLIDLALSRVKRKVSPKQYQIYFLRVLKEMPMSNVCQRLNVNRGQIYLAKHRVTGLLRKEVQRLASEAVNLTGKSVC